MFRQKKEILKKISVFLKFSKAFSLLELLLVLVIIAFVFTFVSRTVFRKDQRVKSVFEKLVRLNRRLVTASKLHSKTYRLAIESDKEGPEQYWVEKKERGQGALPETKEKEKNKGNSGFALDDSFFSRPEVITPLLNITKVESPVWKEDKTEGLVYIYYYPKGLAQELSIQFLRPDNQGRWTLYSDPATKNFHLLKGSKGLAKKKLVK